MRIMWQRVVRRAMGLVFTAACGAILLAGAGAAPAPQSQPLTYVDILHQLTDLDRLTRLQTGEECGIFSSWDRNSRTAWGANGDAGQYLRIEPNGEAVMMDIDGPGVIYRTWSANPVGKIRIYLDGAEKPSYEWNFPDLFDGKMPPFIKPLVYRRDSAQSASDCYVPISFAKHIKITADKAHGQYYHFNYILYPKDRPVPSFRLPLTTEEEAALKAAAEVWGRPGQDPKLRLPHQKTIAKKVTIRPGQTVVLASIRSAGMIRAIRARVQSNQRYAWRKLVLRAEWDDAKWPQVLTPLGPFFGFDWETAEYGSAPAGCLDGQAYQYYPMPFRKSAHLWLTNYLEMPATVEYEIEWAPLRSLPDDTCYFYARWRHEPDSTTFDYPFIETAGHGHFVGVAMPIDHPLAGWWGEGDEKVWVDNDDWPRWIGTGSEDYFGDAWGIRYLPGPSFGASSMKDHRTCNYRWHFMDTIPFTRRMRMTIENYGPNGVGPRGQYEYSSTAFWYQAELTPPFAELRGVTYTGGDDPTAAPGPRQYNPNVFSDLTAQSVRTYGLAVTFAQQAETLLAGAVETGSARVITDALKPYEFDRERAVDFGTVSAGQKLADIDLTSATDTVFFPRLYTAPESGIADLTLVQDGKPLPILGKPQPRIIELGGLLLTGGVHTLGLAAASAGHAVIDCLQLEPAPRFGADTIEAEELSVVRTTGGAPAPTPSEPMRAVSAGRVLRFAPASIGQGFVLNLGKRPALPYVLGVRAAKGPKASIIQAFVDGKPIGPPFDLYAPDWRLEPAILPLGPVPDNSKEVEIRIVGANPASQGREAELDYFRWEPAILGPGTAEGVWAFVLGTHGCEYRAQDLGPAYSGGHQLWIQPSSRNAWVDIAIETPKAGSYEFVVKYTKSWDYASIQAFLDGKPLGPVTDTYSPAVVSADPLTLGKADLTAGRHILRFQAVDHNPASQGYLMGIDHVIVR